MSGIRNGLRKQVAEEEPLAFRRKKEVRRMSLGEEGGEGEGKIRAGMLLVGILLGPSS